VSILFKRIVNYFCTIQLNKISKMAKYYNEENSDIRANNSKEIILSSMDYYDFSIKKDNYKMLTEGNIIRIEKIRNY
jgi:hypothetical protein